MRKRRKKKKEKKNQEGPDTVSMKYGDMVETHATPRSLGVQARVTWVVVN